jgi:tellurite resistance protein TehA-like permease
MTELEEMPRANQRHSRVACPLQFKHSPRTGEDLEIPISFQSSTAAENFENRYAICMNTGLLGTLLHQLPYKFHGYAVLSTCFWIANIVLFSLFTIVQIIRHILYPKAALRQTCATMDELCFWGCVPIAFVTIIAQTALNGSTTSSWGDTAQHGFTILAFVLWWIDVAVMLAVAYVAYYLIAKRRMAEKIPIPSFIFLPAVGTTTVGLVGGIIANYAYNASARLAVPVILVSYLLEGFGWWLAVLIYPVFLGELWSKGLPQPFRMPTLMMLVGHFAPTQRLNLF